VNYAINRAELIQYATRGNGVIVPALVPVQGVGYDPALMAYPFDPDKARHRAGGDGAALVSAWAEGKRAGVSMICGGVRALAYAGNGRREG
jgi:ABC-type transport system substrate-binding protein